MYYCVQYPRMHQVRVFKMKIAKQLRNMGLLAFGVAILAGATPSQAQGGQPDFSQVEIKTTKLADNVYTLVGRAGSIGVPPGTTMATDLRVWVCGVPSAGEPCF